MANNQDPAAASSELESSPFAAGCAVHSRQAVAGSGRPGLRLWGCGVPVQPAAHAVFPRSPCAGCKPLHLMPPVDPHPPSRRARLPARARPGRTLRWAQSCRSGEIGSALVSGCWPARCSTAGRANPGAKATCRSYRGLSLPSAGWRQRPLRIRLHLLGMLHRHLGSSTLQRSVSPTAAQQWPHPGCCCRSRQAIACLEGRVASLGA